MKRMVGIVISLSLFGYAAWAQLTSPWGNQKVIYIPAAKECDTAGALKYCVYRAVDGVNSDIVYHLHGRNLDENAWNDDTYFTAMLQNYWQRQKAKPPTVVSISFGPVWLLAKKGRAPQSGLLEEFLAGITTIESRLGTPRSRILLGESMGGLNVLAAGLAAPERFTKIASLCPGLYIDSPFSPQDVLEKAIERTGADPKIIFGVVQMVKQYIADEKEWDEFSPLKKIETLSQRPSLYLSCGLYDNYGNYEGTDAFASKAVKLGFPTEWHPLYGGHCAIDVVSLGEFLTH